jgi:hypothetical protein
MAAWERLELAAVAFAKLLRSARTLIASGHTRGDRREHQDAFESFTEYEDADIQRRYH